MVGSVLTPDDYYYAIFMSTRTFNLFISHSWSYGDSYKRLVALLTKRQDLKFKNYSVPRDNPVHQTGTTQELREAIRQHMSPCSIVLAIAGVYATYSEWIYEEIVLAQAGFNNPKPILAIVPWRNKRISQVVQRAANDVVHWNTNSIVDAIERLA